MANLKEKIQCLSGVSTSNKSFIQKLIDAKDAYITKTKNAAKAQWNAITSNATAAIAKADGIKNKILNADELLASEIGAAKQKFLENSTVKFLTNKGTCLLAQNNDPKNIKVNPVAEGLSLPLTNEDGAILNSTLVSDNSVTQLKKADNVAKSVSLTKEASIIGSINNKLGTMGVSERREFVRQYKTTHPSIDSYISTLSYFRPVSEYVGASYFGYCVDKQTLPLKDWQTRATCVRKVVKEKLPLDVYNEIENSYKGLNVGLYSNISREFIKERNEYATFPLNVSHSFHIAGDVGFYAYHVLINGQSMLMNALLPVFSSSVGDTLTLINYLTPIKENITVDSETFTIENNGNVINIDKRGNLVRPTFTSTDNTSISPEVIYG